MNQDKFVQVPMDKGIFKGQCDINQALDDHDFVKHEGPKYDGLRSGPPSDRQGTWSARSLCNLGMGHLFKLAVDLHAFIFLQCPTAMLIPTVFRLGWKRLLYIAWLFVAEQCE